MWATLLLLLLLLFVVLYLLIITSTVAGFWRTHVPFIRSGVRDTQFVLSSLHLQPDQVFVDLGSGNGQVVFIAEQLGGVRGVGYELTLWAFWWAKIAARIRRSGVRFYRKDFFKSDWASFDVLYCYLYPPLMRSVEEKFIRETKPGALLICRAFSLPNLVPERVICTPSKHPTFIYRKAAR